MKLRVVPDTKYFFLPEDRRPADLVPRSLEEVQLMLIKHQLYADALRHHLMATILMASVKAKCWVGLTAETILEEAARDDPKAHPRPGNTARQVVIIHNVCHGLDWARRRLHSMLYHDVYGGYLGEIETREGYVFHPTSRLVADLVAVRDHKLSSFAPAAYRTKRVSRRPPVTALLNGLIAEGVFGVIDLQYSLGWPEYPTAKVITGMRGYAKHLATTTSVCSITPVERCLIEVMIEALQTHGRWCWLESTFLTEAVKATKLARQRDGEWWVTALARLVSVGAVDIEDHKRPPEREATRECYRLSPFYVQLALDWYEATHL